MGKRKKSDTRYRTRNAQASNARWRGLPATPEQLKVLQRIEHETGASFPAEITRGEASTAIAQRFADDDRAARAHRRAERARKRDRSNGTESDRLRRAAARRDWRFGVGQHWREHLAEIRDAQRAGLEVEYLEAQRLASGGG